MKSSELTSSQQSPTERQVRNRRCRGQLALQRTIRLHPRPPHGRMLRRLAQILPAGIRVSRTQRRNCAKTPTPHQTHRPSHMLTPHPQQPRTRRLARAPRLRPAGEIRRQHGRGHRHAALGRATLRSVAGARAATRKRRHGPLRDADARGGVRGDPDAHVHVAFERLAQGPVHEVPGPVEPGEYSRGAGGLLFGVAYARLGLEEGGGRCFCRQGRERLSE